MTCRVSHRLQTINTFKVAIPPFFCSCWPPFALAVPPNVLFLLLFKLRMLQGSRHVVVLVGVVLVPFHVISIDQRLDTLLQISGLKFKSIL